VLHTHLIHADVIGALASFTARGVLVSSIHSTARHYKTRTGAAVARIAARRADRVIAISDHVHRFVVASRFAPSERVVTVHYGIDVAAWDPAPTPRERWGWRDDEVVFVIASRLVPHKGHDTAIRAARLAAKRCDRVRLAIVGDGPLRSTLVDLVRDSDANHIVQLVGYQTDMHSVFASADVVVFPTGEGFGEGFGLVNLEAMAGARPIVASRVASVPEIVADGVTGVLVPPEDVTGFADAFVSLAGDADRRRALGEAGRARALELFTLEHMVERTLQVYEDALAR
jgi:glycosyltransferase involved in cell wall biosynthesis